MHEVLSSSRHIFGSAKKEVNFWGRADCASRLDEYRVHFPVREKPGAAYYLESTPHYFQAPNVFVDIASQIKGAVPDVRPVVILRNPIDRYRSAFTHHIHKGRLDYTPEIDLMTDDHIMLSIGLYGRILSHWKTVFPDIIVGRYDDLKDNPAAAIRHLFSELKIPCDISPDTLSDPIHTSAHKVKKSGWPAPPRLTPGLHNRLVDFYREDILTLQSLVHFDVTSWLKTA